MSDNKKKAILSSAVLLFVLSLVNKGLGFIKSMTIASVFGATIQTDAYYVAEGLMQNALIPISEAVAVSFLPIILRLKKRIRKKHTSLPAEQLQISFCWLLCCLEFCMW